MFLSLKLSGASLRKSGTQGRAVSNKGAAARLEDTLASYVKGTH